MYRKHLSYLVPTFTTDVVFLLSDSSMMHSEQRQLANMMVPGITGYLPQGLVYSLLVLNLLTSHCLFQADAG